LPEFDRQFRPGISDPLASRNLLAELPIPARAGHFIELALTSPNRTALGASPTRNREKFDNKGALLKPGTFLANPAKHAHYAWTGNDEAIVQVQFIGPRGIDYINPVDDPRKKTN
jgi:hypothetical protein